MFNRRHFMLAGTSAVASVVAAPNALASSIHNAMGGASANDAQQTNGQSFKAKYAARLQQKFYARSEDGSGLLKLDEVIDGPLADNLEQFTLVFTGNAELPDNLYSLTHLATFESSQLRLDKSQIANNKYIASFSLLTQ